MAKAGDKSSTNDKIGTEKLDEEIAGLFKPKSHKTRSTDDPQVKHAQRKAVRDAVEKFKAGHRAPRMTSISLREIPEWRALLDQEREQRERLFETLPTDGEQHRAASRVIEAGLHAGERMDGRWPR